MEKFIKRPFTSISEEIEMHQSFPDVLYYKDIFRDGEQIFAHCVTAMKDEYKIDYLLFTKFYERAHEDYCAAKSVLDKRLLTIFTTMEQDDFSWKIVKESIGVLKKKYSCFEAYIEMEYCKKQEELQKYEPLG